MAKTTNTLILPATVSDVGSMIALAMSAIRQTSPIATIKS
ncbi:MAG: band-7 C-terminal domain-containing protein [Pseudomonadota bacterium]